MYRQIGDKKKNFKSKWKYIHRLPEILGFEYYITLYYFISTKATNQIQTAPSKNVPKTFVKTLRIDVHNLRNNNLPKSSYNLTAAFLINSNCILKNLCVLALEH